MTLLSGPNISGNEWKYVKDCLDTAWISSVGSYVNKFEEVLADFTGAKYAVATSSGTTALHISLMLAGVTAEDYVIVPNITFIASLNSIKYTGADPILIDVDEATWQMDIGLLKSFLEEETIIKDDKCIYIKNGRTIKAIMPVHVLGNIGDIDELLSLASANHLAVIEDATESLGSYYKEQHTGTFGLFGTFSFNGNKIITTGGGGMIVTNDEVLAKKAKHLTTQAKCDPFEYNHDAIGYNYRLVNVLAAIGVAQMEQLPSFIKRKYEIADAYENALTNTGDIRFQQEGEDVKANKWLFTIRTSKQKQLLAKLNEAGLQSRPFWVPMNQLQMFKDSIYYTKHNIANLIYQECLSIPCSTNISEQEIQSVIKVIKDQF